MKRKKRGFTLIEVSLFLAITGVLFISVTLGVQNSIFRQRYNDSVQGFADFLKNIYSQVMNVQNIGDGMSEYAIYGKMVTFGEKESGVASNGQELIYSYDVIARIGDISNGNTLEALKDLGASVGIGVESGGMKTPGLVEGYTPKWGARIEKTENREEFIGTLLIVRHPRSGVVYTYVMEGTAIEASKAIRDGKMINILDDENINRFDVRDVDFCIDPELNNENIIRRDVRVSAGARNSAGVDIVPDYESRCVK